MTIIHTKTPPPNGLPPPPPPPPPPGARSMRRIDVFSEQDYTHTASWLRREHETLPCTADMLDHAATVLRELAAYKQALDEELESSRVKWESSSSCLLADKENYRLNGLLRVSKRIAELLAANTLNCAAAEGGRNE